MIPTRCRRLGRGASFTGFTAAAATSAITLVALHVYFAILPEKRMYLRAMIRGWMTKDESARALRLDANTGGN